MALAQTHNSALKRLLEADPTDIRRTCLEYVAINAVLEKEIKALQEQCSVLAHKLNKVEQELNRVSPFHG